MSFKQSRIHAETQDHIKAVESQYREGLITLREALTSIINWINDKEQEMFRIFHNNGENSTNTVEDANQYLRCLERVEVFKQGLDISILPKREPTEAEANE